jgi:citrate lyase subunit beta / citryl-CoA lyase
VRPPIVGASVDGDSDSWYSPDDRAATDALKKVNVNTNEWLNASREPGVRRSALSVPGSSPRMLEKALHLRADEIVIDLEDSVAPDAKDDARDLVAAFLARDRQPAALMAVRVNALAGPWGERDVVELARRSGTMIHSLILPKVECAQDILQAQQLLESAGGGSTAVRLQALVETAGGLVHSVEIAAASPRLEALILGYADLAASLGRAPGPLAPESWLYAQETLLVAARAAGLQAIDGPYLEIRDDAGLRVRAEHVRSLGFDGKWAVHPDQLTVINEVFTPTAAEVARAHAVLGALDAARGVGAVALDGEMIDEASRKLAALIVARARAAGVGGASQ